MGGSRTVDASSWTLNLLNDIGCTGQAEDSNEAKPPAHAERSHRRGEGTKLRSSQSARSGKRNRRRRT